MAQPQPLPNPLPTDLKELQKLLNSRYTERAVLAKTVEQGRTEIEAYDKQIKILQVAAKVELKIDEKPPVRVLADPSQEKDRSPLNHNAPVQTP